MYQGKARNGHGPAPRVKAYQGTQKNRLSARLRRWRRKWQTLDFFGAHFAAALGLCSMLYLAVR